MAFLPFFDAWIFQIPEMQLTFTFGRESKALFNFRNKIGVKGG